MAKSRKTLKRYLVIPEVKIACDHPRDALGMLLYQAFVEDDVLCTLRIADDEERPDTFKFSARQRKSLTSKGIPLRLLELLERAHPMVADEYASVGSLVQVTSDQAWELIQCVDWESLPAYKTDQASLVESLEDWLELDEFKFGLTLKSMLPVLQHPLLLQALETGINKALPGYAEYQKKEAERKRRGSQREAQAAMQLLESLGYKVIKTESTPIRKKSHPLVPRTREDWRKYVRDVLLQCDITPGASRSKLKANADLVIRFFGPTFPDDQNVKAVMQAVQKTLPESCVRFPDEDDDPDWVPEWIEVLIQSNYVLPAANSVA